MAVLIPTELVVLLTLTANHIQRLKAMLFVDRKAATVRNLLTLAQTVLKGAAVSQLFFVAQRYSGYVSACVDPQAFALCNNPSSTKLIFARPEVGGLGNKRRKGQRRY